MLLWVCLFLLFGCTFSGVVHYKAAVVQHGVVYTGSPATTIAAGYDYFGNQAYLAKLQGAQIILMPEGGNGWTYAKNRTMMGEFCEDIPVVSNGVPTVIPCNNTAFRNTSQLARGSCIAAQNRMVVQVNLCDHKKCTPSDPNCPTDGFYQYNTVVAFDEQGAMLAVYHKSHISGSFPMYNEPRKPDVVYFDTSFGVRFGIMICQDIGYSEPLQGLLRAGVRDFAYSTSWANEPPILTAVGIQQGWSKAQQVNLLASNDGFAPLKDGFGIFSSGISIKSEFTLNSTNYNGLLVATVATSSTGKNIIPRNLPQPPPLPPRDAAYKYFHKTFPCDWSLFGITALSGNCQSFIPSQLDSSYIYFGKTELTVPGYPNLSCQLKLDPYWKNAESSHPWFFGALFSAPELPGTPDTLAFRGCFLSPCTFPQTLKNGKTQCTLSYTPEYITRIRHSTMRVRSVMVTSNGQPAKQHTVEAPLVSVDGGDIIQGNWWSYSHPGNRSIQLASIGDWSSVHLSSLATFTSHFVGH